MRAIARLAALAALAGVAASMAARVAPAQDAPQPVFRSSVELLHVQVSVLDGTGTAVGNLEPADFVVTLDGERRPVRFARFYGGASDAAEDRGEATAVQSIVPAAPAAASNTAGPPGRIVVFVVDRDSLRAGSGKWVLQTAATLLRHLSPNDASGFLALPARRVTIDRDHDRVRRGLEAAVGTQRAPQHWRYHLDLREALAFERNDIIGIKHVLERECVSAPGDCSQIVAEQARELLLTVRAETDAMLQALRGVIGGLREIRAPKVVVLLSGGVWFEQEALLEFRAITREAAAARTVVHAIQVDQSAFDAEDRGRGPSPFAASERQDGLRQIAASTGGAFYHAVGRAEGVFGRLGTEVTEFYELGIELEAADANSKLRTLRVDVTRPGAVVRTRRDVVVVPPSTTTAPRARVDELLRQPVNVSDLPVRLGAYVTRGDEASTLKVILAADVDVTGAAGPIDWGFVVLREGEQVTAGRDRSGEPPIVTAAQLRPGVYRIRFAAVRGDGREGTIETELPVGLRVYGDLQSSDVIVGDTDTGRFVPRSSMPAGREAQALVELYASEPASFDAVTVVWELYEGASMRLVRGAPCEPRRTDAPGRRVCDVALPLPESPGTYVLSAVVQRGGRPVGKVSRRLHVQARPEAER